MYCYQETLFAAEPKHNQAEYSSNVFNEIKYKPETEHNKCKKIKNTTLWFNLYQDGKSSSNEISIRTAFTSRKSNFLQNATSHQSNCLISITKIA